MRRRSLVALIAAAALALASTVGGSAGGPDGKKSDGRKGSSVSTFKADVSS